MCASQVVNYMKGNPKHAWWAAPAADGIFGIFALTFFVSRLAVYPYYCLYNCIFVAEYAVNDGGRFYVRPNVFYLFNIMLSILQVRCKSYLL